MSTETESTIANPEAPATEAPAMSELATVRNSNGSSTFSIATLKAYIRATEGLAGKALSKRVYEEMAKQQAYLLAGIAGTIANKGMAVESVRNLKSGKLAVTYATPKLDKDKALSAAQKALAESEAKIKAMEDRINAMLAKEQSARDAAENAPAEPAAIEELAAQFNS